MKADMVDDWSELLRRADASDDPYYLRIDEREDLVASLEQFAKVSQNLDTRPVDWKWALIALHLCIQGALVCALSGTNGLGAMNHSSARKWNEWYEKRRKERNLPPPEEKLADTRTLFKRAQRSDYMHEFGGNSVAITQSEADSFERLMELRNAFSHFSRKGWSIELLGLPQISLETMSVVERLCRHPAIDFRMEASQRERCSAAIKSVRAALSALHEVYSKICDNHTLPPKGHA